MRPGRYDRAPPAPRRRWNLRATRRQQLLEELDAIIRTLTAIALAAPSPLLLATGEVSVVIGYMLMMTSWLTMISMALDFARTSASAFYAKRRLGAHGSGAMLPGHGPRRRVPPPTLDDWSDDLAVARTRFDVIQLRAMLHGFGLMRIDGSPKRYRVYQSGKLYSKKRPGGGFYKSSHAKYFHVQADTALILVLMYLAIPGRMCDLSQSMGGMPEPEMSLVINFMFHFVNPWCRASRSLMLYLPRFDMYATAIEDKGSTIGCGGFGVRVVGFTDGTLIETCRPGGGQNLHNQVYDFTQFDGNHRAYGNHFLGLSFPDGLVALHGPFGGTRHDSAMLHASSILNHLAHLRLLGYGWWAIFGDSAFPLTSHSYRMTRQPATDGERWFNGVWAKIRITNEWAFAHLLGIFSRLRWSLDLKMCKVDVGARVQTSSLFANLHSCFWGNQTALYFGVHTPSPSFILTAAVGVLPDNVVEV
eukprot:Tamp_14526.p1 GENE.Tamp_14526~~Tamp_14526.p1  ORF type:complete len:474 (+),score=30.32 Tamp_14526:185-1606(+)